MTVMAYQFRRFICPFYCILLTFAAKTEKSTSKMNLHIGGLFGVNVAKGSWSTAGVIPALEMALDHVNGDPSILVDYQLKYVWNDSKVCRITTIQPVRDGIPYTK